MAKRLPSPPPVLAGLSYVRPLGSGGFADVNNDVLTVLAESAEMAQDIDTARAMAAKERAEKRIADHAEQIDAARAEAALHRALIRLQVSQQR